MKWGGQSVLSWFNEWNEHGRVELEHREPTIETKFIFSFVEGV